MTQASTSSPVRRGDVRASEDARAAYFLLKDQKFGNRVTFEFRNGRRKSLPYMQLVETDFDPDVGIILTYVGHRVTLTGRNIKELAIRFEEEQVGEVYEQHMRDLEPADPGERNAWERTTVIEQIMWELI